jgi:hypothetical protein
VAGPFLPLRINYKCNRMQCDAMKAMLSNAMEYDGIQCSNKTRCLKRKFVVITQFAVAWKQIDFG